MKILFLDDDEQRHTYAATALIGHDVTHVRTVPEALKQLAVGGFDVAMLDHDLGGQHYAPSNEVSGYAVAQAIEAGQVKVPRVVVHSFNAAGATRMVAAIANSGVPVAWAPFGPGAFAFAVPA